jgi:integrase/recombinase XerD
MRARPDPSPKLLPPAGDVRDPDSMYHHMLRYLAHLTERNYSLRTVEIRNEQLRYFILWCDERGLTRPQQVDRPILEAYQRHVFYYRKKNGDPIAASNQHQRVNALHQWLRWLVKQGCLLYNPAADLDMPRVEKRLPKAGLSAKEAETVLAVPDVRTALGLRDRAILETFYSTGMRRKELADLTVYNLDTERETVMIRQGKGNKDRVVPIGERALAWIANYRDNARPGFVVGKDEGTLFLNIMGEPLDLQYLTQLIAEYVDRAEIGKQGSCHMFRHTMATLMLENGADIRVIQAILGHSNLETTQIYTHVSIRHLKAVHTATHPGKFAKVGQHALEAGEEPGEPTAEDVLSRLDLEAEEEG